MQPAASVVRRRVADAAFRVFGVVEGSGKRSGRKVLRRARQGPAVADWYPATLKELAAPGYEEPILEDFYRLEQELNRVGKTRSTGKIKPLRDEVVERIQFADYNLEEVNWDKSQSVEEGDVVEDDVAAVETLLDTPVDEAP